MICIIILAFPYSLHFVFHGISRWVSIYSSEANSDTRKKGDIIIVTVIVSLLGGYGVAIGRLYKALGDVEERFRNVFFYPAALTVLAGVPSAGGKGYSDE